MLYHSFQANPSTQNPRENNSNNKNNYNNNNSSSNSAYSSFTSDQNPSLFPVPQDQQHYQIYHQSHQQLQQYNQQNRNYHNHQQQHPQYSQQAVQQHYFEPNPNSKFLNSYTSTYDQQRLTNSQEERDQLKHPSSTHYYHVNKPQPIFQQQQLFNNHLQQHPQVNSTDLMSWQHKQQQETAVQTFSSKGNIGPIPSPPQQQFSFNNHNNHPRFNPQTTNLSFNQHDYPTQTSHQNVSYKHNPQQQQPHPQFSNLQQPALVPLNQLHSEQSLAHYRINQKEETKSPSEKQLPSPHATNPSKKCEKVSVSSSKKSNIVSPVLLVIVFELKDLEITNDDFQQVLSKYGFVNKVLIFNKFADQTKALVEMASLPAAITAQEDLKKSKIAILANSTRLFKIIVHFSTNQELNLCNYKTEGRDYREVQSASSTTTTKSGTQSISKSTDLISTEQSPQQIMTSSNPLPHSHHPRLSSTSQIPQKYTQPLPNAKPQQRTINHHSSTTSMTTSSMSFTKMPTNDVLYEIDEVNYVYNNNNNNGSSNNNNHPHKTPRKVIIDSYTDIESTLTPPLSASSSLLTPMLIPAAVTSQSHFLPSNQFLESYPETSLDTVPFQAISLDQVTSIDSLEMRLQSTSISPLPTAANIGPVGSAGSILAGGATLAKYQLNKEPSNFNLMQQLTNPQHHQQQQHQQQSTSIEQPLSESPVIYIKTNCFEQVELNPENIYNIFRNFGFVMTILFLKEKNAILIQYEEPSQARMAINQMNNIHFPPGFPFRISFAKHKTISVQEHYLSDPSKVTAFYFVNKSNDPRKKTPTGQGLISNSLNLNKKTQFYNPATRTIYVANIPVQFTQRQEELHQLFSQYGRISEKQIKKNDVKVIALIEYETVPSALQAIAFLHNTLHYGKLLQVFFTRSIINQ